MKGRELDANRTLSNQSMEEEVFAMNMMNPTWMDNSILKWASIWSFTNR